jgi:acetyl-CoA carboxylase biotin carboxylase subunit
MLSQARAEAEAAFGNGGLYLEKFLAGPRHIEIQVLGDQHGNLVHLNERDCTMQRRRQKLVEESPSPVLDRNGRRLMGEAALRLCRAAGYTNAGTVEFLWEQGKFYFMEMNTRIQVEHPVTEMVTGLDLVEEQIRVAAGLPLRFRQKDVRQDGHAMEFRVNAEDPDRQFAPCPGTVSLFFPPEFPGVRTDTFVYSGYRVPPNYDSMIAKVIVHAPTRGEVFGLAKRALKDCLLEGVKTTIPFHRQLLENVDFVKGEYDINFIERTFL